MDFCHSGESYLTNMKNSYWMLLDALKTTSEKIFHEKAKATREFIGNKIADEIVKEILTKLEKKFFQNMEQIKKCIINWNIIKYLNY